MNISNIKPGTLIRTTNIMPETVYILVVKTLGTTEQYTRVSGMRYVRNFHEFIVDAYITSQYWEIVKKRES